MWQLALIDCLLAFHLQNNSPLVGSYFKNHAQCPHTLEDLKVKIPTTGPKIYFLKFGHFRISELAKVALEVALM